MKNMKRILCRALPVLLTVAMCLALASCGVDTVTPYNELLEQTLADKNEDGEIVLKSGDETIRVALIPLTVDGADGGYDIVLQTIAFDQTYIYNVDITLPASGEDTARFYYRCITRMTNSVSAEALALVELRRFTGNELLEFDSVNELTPNEEFTARVNASALSNSALIAFDRYCRETLDRSAAELGFSALDEKYQYTVDSTAGSSEEDLGPALSAARWGYAGRMTLLGVGMVFAVLALLWLILSIFKHAFAKEPAKKKTEAPASTPAPATPVPAPTAAPASNDDALIAAITAAIAATIESDPALQARFVGGFRVVSFKKKSGKTSWNH